MEKVEFDSETDLSAAHKLPVPELPMVAPVDELKALGASVIKEDNLKGSVVQLDLQPVAEKLEVKSNPIVNDVQKEQSKTHTESFDEETTRSELEKTVQR